MSDNSKNPLKARATLGIKLSTKVRLDKHRAPGQCYDGFICQMIDLWERVNKGKPGNLIETLTLD